MGDQRRWRTMPWLVLVFGLLIVPLGAISIGFIMPSRRHAMARLIERWEELRRIGS